MRWILVLIASCAVAAARPDQRVADLAAAGEVRVGLFSTQYRAGPEPQGARPDILRALAADLGVRAAYVLRRNPLEVVDCLLRRECDAVVLHRDSRNAHAGEFSYPFLQYEFTMLVRAESPVRDAAEVDRPGARVAAVRGHAAAVVLQSKMQQAAVDIVDDEAAAMERLRSGRADAVAQTRHSLVRMSAGLPGSRVLSGNYGMNVNRVAVPKGELGRLDRINEFIERAKASGLLQSIVDRDAGSAFQVAPPREGAIP